MDSWLVSIFWLPWIMLLWTLVGFFFQYNEVFKKKTHKKPLTAMLPDNVHSSMIKDIHLLSPRTVERGVRILISGLKNNPRVNRRKTFHEAFLSGGGWHAHQSKASHLFLQTRLPLTRPDIWVCLQLKVSDSPVKTIHLSAGQMLSKTFLHLSGAKQRGKKPQGI